MNDYGNSRRGYSRDDGARHNSTHDHNNARDRDYGGSRERDSRRDETRSSSRSSNKTTPFLGIYKPYAIRVDKDTPDEVYDAILEIAKDLADDGWVLRVSGTDDRLLDFDVKQEVVLPFASFECNTNNQTTFPTKNCTKLSGLIIRGWDKIPEKARSFAVHAIGMIVGTFINSPVKLFITWTPDNCISSDTISRETGYMAQLIDVCGKFNVPVFNMGNRGEGERILNYSHAFHILRDNEY